MIYWACIQTVDGGGVLTVLPQTAALEVLMNGNTHGCVDGASFLQLSTACILQPLSRTTCNCENYSPAPPSVRDCQLSTASCDLLQPDTAGHMMEALGLKNTWARNVAQWCAWHPGLSL